MHVGWGLPIRAALGIRFPSRLWAKLLGGRRNPGREGNWPQVVSGYIFPASLFSADQFVVSVPTEVSGCFNEIKILFVQGNGGEGWGEGMLREGQATAPEYFRPHGFP